MVQFVSLRSPLFGAKWSHFTRIGEDMKFFSFMLAERGEEIIPHPPVRRKYHKDSPRNKIPR